MVAKRKGFAAWPLVFLAIVIALPLIYMSSVRSEGFYPAGSILSKASSGSSVFFESLRSMGMSVSQHISSSGDVDRKTLQILPGKTIPNEKDPLIQNWVSKGGTVVFLVPEPVSAPPKWATGKSEAQIDGLMVFRYHQGTVAVFPLSRCTNGALIKNSGSSWPLANWIQNRKPSAIVFNESSLYPDGLKDSFWNAVPLWGRVLVYQIFVLLIGWFWLKGQRFGKPRPLLDETERDEFESLESAAHFYQRSGAWNKMVHIHFLSLLRVLGATPSDWLDRWNRENLPDYSEAAQVDAALRSEPTQWSSTEASRVIAHITHLKKHAQQRRNPLGIHIGK